MECKRVLVIGDGQMGSGAVDRLARPIPSSPATLRPADTALAALTQHPDKFVGMHFFNPAPVMKLVEIIRGLATSEDTYSRVKTLAEKLGKAPVTVADFPGFVGNRIMMPMINEAVYTLMEGVATAEDM
ncbi:3-hydroxybutyryl-CoA dehydrogenase [Sporomusa termitida]|uniref:3-hydroxybutyryl-CoA dehydrogenase n=1 Tax=Sporomusa termitida TaxID=2377 RepID=A0A517DWU7_9FIRM|nr:3-hydroxybutyryl-CoA dehydrogenase [Sporomusa termitida]